MKIMEETKIVNYFFVAGLPEKIIDKEPFTSSTTPKLPITDVAIINKSQGESPPKGYECLSLTPSRFPANLNHGSLVSPEMYICYKRGRDKPPIIDIGVMYHSKHHQRDGCQVVTETPNGLSANVSNSSSEKIYLTFCRAEDVVEWDTLAVSDICVILPGKGEMAPSAFHKIDKNLNLGMIGSDVYLCYRKSFIKNKCLTYDAEFLFRYPLEDHPTLELPEQLPMFCLPLGATIERWCATSRHPLPLFSTFVLTNQLGQKCYGAAVVFYKDFDDKFLSKEQRDFFDEDDKDAAVEVATKNGLEKEANGKALAGSKKEIEDKYIYQQNQSICLLSKWPFFDAFKKFLLYIYRISVSGPQAVPIERYISQFFNEIPFPSPERPYVSIQLSNEEIVLVQPDESPLPKSGASFSKFLLNLAPDLCLNIFLTVLLEHKIVIHSIRPDLLTCVAEAISMIIFPFTWQCPYVPLCPLQLSDILDSPTPFIIGLDSCYFDNPDPYPPSDITYMDLDAQSFTLSQERTEETIKLFPKKALKTLKASLEHLYNSLLDDSSCPGTPGNPDCCGSFSIRDALNQQKQRKVDAQIQECFLRFMADLLKGYSSFLLPVSDKSTDPDIDISALFDVPGFLKSRDRSYQKLLSGMMKTQYFCRFIEERSLGSKEENSALSFFDECLQKLSTDPDVVLVEVEEKLLSGRTVVIAFHDNVKEIPGVTYSYNGFTNLELELFDTTKHSIKPSSKLSSTLVLTRDLHGSSNVLLRRSRQEVRYSQQVASCAKNSVEATARCLLWTSYSVWFILLPSFIEKTRAKNLLLRLAYKAMSDCISRGGTPLDELPYGIFFQLCGMYRKPQLAVKVYKDLRKRSITLNAVTYGYYNSAILDKSTPPESRGMKLWGKISIALLAMSRLRTLLNLRKTQGHQPTSSKGNTLENFLNIFNKVAVSPKLPADRLFKRNPKNKNISASNSRTLSPSNTDESPSSKHEKKVIATTVESSTEKFIREEARKSQSCEELKGKSVESSPDTARPYIGRRNNSVAQQSRPVVIDKLSVEKSSPDQSLATLNDSLSNILQSAKQHISSTYQIFQSKLNSPSRVNVQSPFRKPSDTTDCSSTRSCLAVETLDSSMSTTSSLSESLHLGSDTNTLNQSSAAADRDDTDTSSMSSSTRGSNFLRRKTVYDVFECHLPHLSVDVTSQMKCNNCSSLLYNEHIMSSWNLSDSDLNTRCHCCSINFVPMLHITIKESARPLLHSIADDLCTSDNAAGPKYQQSSGYLIGEFEVQYLNPLVLRKELENMIGQKGENYINQGNLIEEHSIIFWNLLWIITRLGLPTHLKEKLLIERKHQSVNQVVMKTLWDSPHIIKDFGLPMYMLWRNPTESDDDENALFSRSLLQQLVSGVVIGKIPIDAILVERSRNLKKKSKALHRSIFHDVLFLSIAALGYKNVDIDKFEIDYRTAFDALPTREKRKLMAADEPPARAVTWCRKLFRPLHISSSRTNHTFST